MRWSLFALLAAALTGAACGGDDGPRPPDTPPSGGTIVRGGERLAWDQQAPSAAVVQSYSYVLYVDGARNTLADVRCDATAGPSGYTCSGRLPSLRSGTRVLELAAASGGVEGPRSAPLTVTVNPASTASMGTARSVTPIACLEAPVDDCYDAVALARNLGPVRDFSVAGAIAFFIEGSRRVRVLAAGAVTAEPAFEAADEDTRLVSLALAHDFEASRHVFVGSVQRWPDGREEFQATRYREVSGSLGEGIAVATGLPASGDEVPMAVDAAGLLYVALPGTGDRGSSAALAYNGSILRFSSDGRVPDDQRTPVLARAYAQPTSIVPENAPGRVWLSGRGPAPLAALRVDSRGAAHLVPAAVEPDLAAEGGFRIAFGSSASPSAAATVWLVDAAGQLFRGTRDDVRVRGLRRIDPGLGSIAALTDAGPHGLFLVTRPSAGEQDRGWTIYRLRGRTPR